MADTTQHAQAGFRTTLKDITPRGREIPAAPLGPFGDIPAAHAVFQMRNNFGTGKPVNAHYVYASPEYCRLAACALDDLVGHSHLEVVKAEIDGWAEACQMAVDLGQTTTGIDFSALTQSWVSYCIAPTLVEGCCVCAFVPIDEEQRKQQMSVDERTSQVISELLAALAGEASYDDAMNGMLELIAGVLPSDRLCVYVCNDIESLNAFERCAEGVEPQIGSKSAMTKAVLKAWFNSASKEPIAFVPDTSVLARFSEPLHEWCVESGIHNLLAAPFYSEGEIVGFLGAYNYKLNEGIDIGRVFSALSSFVGAKMDNHRLIEDLAWASRHDALTGLLNRRGAKALLAESIEEHPDVPVVVALLDLDDFKNTNDRYGHAAGDSALAAMGQYLTRAFPETAVLCRTGGDEFLVGLIGDDALRADELVAKFSATRMEYEDEEAGMSRPFSASLGYARFPEQSGSLKGVFSRADKALYAVKHSGKSGCMQYASDMG